MPETPDDAADPADDADHADDGASPPVDDPAGPDDAAPAPVRRARRRRRWPTVLGVVAVLLVLWLGFVAFRLVTAAADAQRGVDALQRVSDLSTGDLGSFVDSVGTPDDPEAQEVQAELATAADAFRSASDAADSPLVAPLKVVPVLGRQIRSVSALSGSAASSTEASLTAFRSLSDVAAMDTSTPEARLAAGDRTQVVLTELADAIADPDLGPKKGLIGPLAEAYDRFAEESDRLNGTVDRALTGVTGVNQFIKGPSNYLVLAANNAEMRAGSGMYLQAGELHVDAGRFAMTELQPTAQMVLDAPGTTVDPDVQALWSWLQPDREWRNINATPRFGESARMAADMWAASGHAPVDGVIAMDVVGLQRMLELVGPVEITEADGTVTSISADNVLTSLLLQQYLGSGSVDERRDRLSTVGQAVFAALNERGYEPGQLLQAVQSAGRGRHLLIWSSDPVEQAGWEALDASGALPGNGLLLSILNRGGNKLDQFLQVAADMRWTTEGDHRRVSVAVTATNAAPENLPRYVGGPYPGLDVEPGQYVGVLALTVPKSATAPATEGADLFLSGEDGPTSRLLATRIDLRRGQSTTITFQFDLPDATDEVVVLPSARVPPVVWTADGDSWKDRKPRSVDLDGT
ncbi:DUF4012 domain-containing protein [Dermatobacter hominis]|uniref:DUF4012 domain-containing protein n=1 Tax=Dermatobacter hominis TaxID=2884263 RepID=UPI001D12F2D9|nr:DUF4012 domain-containing protein [Dermatobacter hominis]UDY37119.1 DUF4012 domain-containing protein [Dermatobacter hominis]